MALLIEGRFTGKAVRAFVGPRYPGGKITVNIDIKLSDGEHAGKVVEFSGRCDENSIRYTKAAARAAGWKGGPISTTLERDIMAAALDLDVELRVATNVKADGKVSQWTSVDRIYGAAIPISTDEARMVDSWFEGDEPQERDDESPGPDSDIPF